MKSIVLKPHEAKGIHEGSITELWREVKPQPDSNAEFHGTAPAREYLGPSKSGMWGAYFDWAFYPCHDVGTRLWCKETFAERAGDLIYRADGKFETPAHCVVFEEEDRWRPSIHMPQWASRTTIEITAVSVEQREGKWMWKYTVKTIEG